jgi:hypothetical protein
VTSVRASAGNARDRQRMAFSRRSEEVARHGRLAEILRCAQNDAEL